MTGDLPLAPEDVTEIVAILERTPYDRIELCTRRFKLSVSRSDGGWIQTWEWPPEPPAAEAAKTRPIEEPLKADGDDPGEGLHSICAPLPGTFYRAPQPGAPPFVDIGSEVRAQSVVGIIETMKLMTPVHAGVSGTVVAVLVENGRAVEAQAALLRVKTDQS